MRVRWKADAQRDARMRGTLIGSILNAMGKWRVREVRAGRANRAEHGNAGRAGSKFGPEYLECGAVRYGLEPPEEGRRASAGHQMRGLSRSVGLG